MTTEYEEISKLIGQLRNALYLAESPQFKSFEFTIGNITFQFDSDLPWLTDNSDSSTT